MHIFEEKKKKTEKYRIFLKCFDFWFIGPKYSCSADKNTSVKCRVTKKKFFSGSFWIFCYFFENMRWRTVGTNRFFVTKSHPEIG